MRKSEIGVLAIVILSFLLGIFFYPRMPELLASHWNIKGQVNGYLPKFWGLFLMPAISTFLLLLFVLIPKIDPLKENIAKFRRYFDTFVLLIIIFLFYLYLLTIFGNLNFRFNLVQLLVPALGILFFYTGILVENAKRNWFIGIRTPWTLSSDQVWEKTHQLGGKLFKAAGVIAFLGVFFQNLAIYFVLVPAVGVSLYMIVFSYFEFQKEARGKS